MIDIGKIIKRAWHILWNYKVLWIFGLLLALTAGRGGGNGSSYQFSGSDFQNGYHPNNYNAPESLQAFNDWVEQNVVPLLSHPERYVPTLIWIGVGFLLFILFISVIFAVIRYPSEAAVIRMVDEYEQSGTKLSFKQGWKLGWTRRAFRMWVIDLVISLPALLVVGFFIGLGVLIYTSIRSGSDFAAIGSVVTAIGCTFLFLFAFILLMVFLNLLRQFFIRRAALEDARVGESFRQGWVMFKRNWKSAALMWLVMLGINIGFGITTMIIFFLLIPVMIVMILPAAIVAAIPGMIAFAITSIFASGPLAWIIAAIVALPFFVMVVFTPLMLISGMYMVFDSNIWTLTYREMKALERNLPIEVPAPVE
jgi:amino acid transporter